ncbi:flagellar hook-length control protein FliK [Helicobacter cetorum]|uniref:flagellar hook-length control protein FliK n=1 Tax=Helicobacter cetorum TaxID=138563 RepID=UPI000CF043C1|nr:flagellar hook-length control protein FliK [Helicobacter cetorum]
MPTNINTPNTQIPTKPTATLSKTPKNPSITPKDSKHFKSLLTQKILKTTPKDSLHKSTTKTESQKPLLKPTSLSNTPNLPQKSHKSPQQAPNAPTNAPTLKDLLSPKKDNSEKSNAPTETAPLSLTPPITTPTHEKSSPKKPTNSPLTPLNPKPNSQNTTPSTPIHSPKTLKDVDLLAKEHNLNANNLHLSTQQETPKKEFKNLSTTQKLAPHLSQSSPNNPQPNPTNTPSHTLSHTPTKEVNLSSVLQSLDTKDLSPQDKSIAPKTPLSSFKKTNLPNDEKKTPPLNESLQTHAIKRAKKPKVSNKSKKRLEKTPSIQKNQIQTLANALQQPLKTPPLTPLTPMFMGLNTHNTDNANFQTPLEKEEKTTPIDTKESVKEPSAIQNTQTTQTSDNKGITPKESIKHFTQQLKQEIQEYKPPMTKISMDLFPKELGKVEVTIQKVGKNLKVSVVSHNNSLQTFLDNQQELKNSLSALGFEGVDLSFSQNHSKEQQSHKEQQLTPLRENALKSYQENTNDEIKELPTNMQITLYA